MSSKLNKHRAKSSDDDDSDDDYDDVETEDDSSLSDSRWDGLKDVAVDED